MDSFELNKILGAMLGTCLGLLSLNIAAGAIFAPVKPAKPGYEIAVPEQKPEGGAKPAEQEKQVPIEQLLAKADISHGAELGQEMRGLPHLRQGRAPTWSGPICGASSAARRPRSRDSTIRLR